MAIDRMSPLDAYFVYAEDDGVNHMHLGGLITLEGTPPAHDEVLAFVESRLVNIPRYRQAMKQVPWDLGRPVWLDDAHFDVSYNVRRTALPAPGGPAELRALFEQVMSVRLDRTRPLWELWVVEGLADGGWAVISKTHHAMVDGVAGTELLTELFSTDPRSVSVRNDADQPSTVPAEAPTDRQLVLGAVTDLVRSPVEQVRAVAGVLRTPRTILNTATGAFGMSRRIARPNVVSTLNGKVGPNRRFAYDHRSLDDVRATREAFGGTINDVVLTAATQGFREFLLSRGEEVEGRTVRTLIPVALHARDERGTAVGDGAAETLRRVDRLRVDFVRDSLMRAGADEPTAELYAQISVAAFVGLQVRGLNGDQDLVEAMFQEIEAAFLQVAGEATSVTRGAAQRTGNGRLRMHALMYFRDH